MPNLFLFGFSTAPRFRSSRFLSFSLSSPPSSPLLTTILKNGHGYYSPRRRLHRSIVSFPSLSLLSGSSDPHFLTQLADFHPPSATSGSAWNLVGDKFSDRANQTLKTLIKFVEVSPPLISKSVHLHLHLAHSLSFLQEECLPAEALFHAQISTDPAKRWKSYPAVIETLKARAKELGLWNIWLSKDHYAAQGGFMTNLEYAVCAEIMGRAIRVAPEACNASAPDTGNMGEFSFLSSLR